MTSARLEFAPDELLALSGIQHFYFCRRQWALIHIERQWQENALTAEGRLMHRRADDAYQTETRNGVIIARGMPVASYRLGLYGVCDVVEFSPAPVGVALHGREGTYQPAPVEDKRGQPKPDIRDEIQLCTQALCLEEMLPVLIPRGFLYYGEIRRRVEVALTDELRGQVERMTAEMHEYYARGYTPRVKPGKACRSCSLKDICLPELQSKVIPASRYIHQHIEGE
jgi:CRISPR-associated exonuclease Cas4